MALLPVRESDFISSDFSIGNLHRKIQTTVVLVVVVVAAAAAAVVVFHFNIYIVYSYFPGEETESNHLAYLLAGTLSNSEVEERFVFLADHFTFYHDKRG